MIFRISHVVATIALVCFLAPITLAEDVFTKADVLCELDVGSGEDPVQKGRWSSPQTEGGRTYRNRQGVSLNRVGIDAWWEGESPAEDVAIVVDYKDVADSQVTLAGWTGLGGIYGYPEIGQLGGMEDGQWKQQFLICPKQIIRRHPEGEWENNWSLLFARNGELPVDRIRIVKLTPAVREKAIQQGLERRRIMIERCKKGMTHQPYEETQRLGVVRQYEEEGFIPFARSYTVDVYPSSIPHPSERGTKVLQTYATPGEFEPLQVAIHALEDQVITVSMTDLTGPGTISAESDVQIRWVESTPIRYGKGGSRAKQWRMAPVWLRHNKPLDVAAGTSQAWNVTFHVPEDAKAGMYKGELTLAAEDGDKAVFPIELRVLPFRLDKADHVARGAYISGIVGDEYIRDLVDHGINSTSRFSSGVVQPKMEDGRCVADMTEAQDTYLRKLKAAGVVRNVEFGGGDPAYNNPANMVTVTGAKVGSEEFATYYGQYWSDIKRLEKERGWPEMICCPFDEPVKSEAKIRNYLICYDIVKDVVPETKVFCVFMNRPHACKQLGTKADIWSCNGAFEVNSAEKARLAAKGIDKLFYTYTGCMASSRPGATRYNAGFLPWHFDADGTYFWAYLWDTNDPFNNLDGDVLDWTPVARDLDGKLYSCVAWDAFREGVDDRLYCETAIRLAEEQGRKDILAKIKRLQSSVQVGKENLESVRTRGLDDFFIRIDNASQLDVYRAEVVGMILDMLGEKDNAS